MSYLNLVELNKGLDEAKKKIKLFIPNLDNEKIIINLHDNYVNVNYENDDLTIDIELSILYGKLFITSTEVFED